MINDFNRRWCVGVKTNLNITRGTTQKTFMYIIVRKSYNFIVNTPHHHLYLQSQHAGWLVCWNVRLSPSGPILDCNDPPDLDWWTLAPAQTASLAATATAGSLWPLQFSSLLITRRLCKPQVRQQLTTVDHSGPQYSALLDKKVSVESFLQQEQCFMASLVSSQVLFFSFKRRVDNKAVTPELLSLARPELWCSGYADLLLAAGKSCCHENVEKCQ